jgi:hypothetical protein
MSAARFSIYFDFVRCLWHENGNLKKNALNKFESLCYADSKHIVQVLSEKNTFKVGVFK